jgi:hypothetical protein
MPQKFVDYRWGSDVIYLVTTNKTPDYRSSGIIEDKWLDDIGNTWYRIYAREDWTKEAFFSLTKVSKDGKVKEWIWRHDDFPSDNNLNSKNEFMHYHICISLDSMILTLSSPCSR